MEPGQLFANINYLAVLVAAFSAFFIGWIWYGPLFGKLWMKLNGFSKEDIHETALPMPAIMGINYVATFLAALAMEVFISAHGHLAFGIFTGVVIAVFWIATSRLNDVLYERKPMALFWINVGYNFVIYVVMGAILGAWH